MKLSFAHIIIFFVISLNSFAQTDVRAKAILDEVSKKYQSFNIVKANFEYTINNPKAKIKDKNLLRKRRIEIRLNKHELETITDKAKSRGLNRSAYLRNISMNYPVKSIVNRQVTFSLKKSNGDLGKLGGLFKR